MTLSRALRRTFLAAALIAAAAPSAFAQADRPGGLAPSPSSGAQPGGEVFMNPAPLGPGLPREDIMEAMLKNALMSFNDANTTGNYAVLAARMHPEFRQQVPPERLAQIFVAFRTNKINLAPLLVHKPVYADGPKLDSNGILVANGYFDTRPWRSNFEFAWRREGDKWLLWKINVRVRPPEQ
jgi:hypothetical protein